MNVAQSSCGARVPRAAGRGLLLITLLASVMLGACETLPSGRAQPAQPPERRAAAWDIDHDVYGELGFRLDWRGFPAVSGGRDPVVDLEVFDDMVLVLDRSSLVSALSPVDGTTLWRNEVANALTSFKGIGVADGRAVVVSESDIYVIDASSGTLVDRLLLDYVANTTPVVQGDAVIYGTSRGELRLHSVRARMEIWGNALWGQSLPGPISTAPVVVNGAIGAVTQGGEVFFIDPSSGLLIAKNSINGGLGSDPVAEGTLMYAASLDQSLYAFSATSGAIVWRHRTSTPLTAQPTVHNGVVYCEIPGEGLTAFDGAYGRIMWNAPDVSGEVICMAGGALICWDGETATRLDPANGDVISTVELVHVDLIVPVGFEDPTLYVVSDKGVVAKFAPR